jgi:ribose transport system permease protein
MAAEVVQKPAESTPFLQRDAAQRILAFAALIILFTFFSLRSPAFLQFNNIVGILLATAVNGILALGVTFVITTGGIDLSIGTVMTFSAVMTAVFVNYWHLPLPLGILGGVITGAFAGLVNGVVIAKMKIPPFIATLGVMYIAKGLSLIISELRPIYFNDTPEFRDLATGSVIGAVIPGFDIPNAVLIFFAVALVAGIIFNKTLLGRYTFALGSNEEATRLSGVNVDRWKMAVYTVCGAFAGLGGVVMAARLNSAQPALGQGYELDAIAAVVIGGTSLAGGEGTITGTIIGAFVMSVLVNGLRIMTVPQEWQTVVTGAIIIVAVYIDIIRRRKS